jgi:multiple sugar transport system substrate-binding protein
MAQIEFSSVGELAPAIAEALQQFEIQTGHQVKVRLMQWEYAWPELLSYALHGHGPDISHVGSTWVSSLVKMNALRPFQPGEVEQVGGAQAFLPSCWNSVVIPGDDTVWALPWTSYTFLLCYRRDLLARVDVEEAGAFASASALHQTLAKLHASRIFLPWIVPSGRPHVDTIHIVASWVWGAKGDFIAEDGCTPLFTHSKAVAGLQAYYELNEYMPRLARNLTPEQVMDLFRRGEAAVTVCGVDEPYAILGGDVAAPHVRETLGVASMPGQPWIGGDSLVIWQHAQNDPHREQAAVELAQFLVSREIQARYCQSDVFAAPTRQEALDALPLAGSETTAQIEKSLRTGRSYRPIVLWGRVETQLSSALNHIWFDIFNGLPVAKSIKHQLEPVAKRLKVALSC